MKKLLALVLAAVMLTASSAMASELEIQPAVSDPGPCEKSEETLVIALNSEPEQLCAEAGLVEILVNTIDGYMTDTLVTIDHGTSEIKPCLATSWEMIDETHYKFTLRDDVIMADGTPLTAEDVLFTIQTAAECGPALDTGKYYNVEECSVVDDHTIIIASKDPNPGFVGLLAQTAYGILSKSATEAIGGVEALKRNPRVGCGEYLFKEWKNGEYILLERNEDYWDPEYNGGYYKYIKFIFVNDAATRMMAIESGDADVALDLPVIAVSQQAANPKLQINIYESSKCQMVYMNTSRGIFADKAVREAVYYAIDPATINMIATSGLGAISGPVISYTSPYYVDVYDGSPEKPVDIEKAKQILADAGYKDGDLNAVAMVQAADQTVMTVIQETLRQIGINLTIDSTDAASYVARAKEGDYDLLFGNQDIFGRMPNSLAPFYGPEIEKDVIGGPKYISEEMDAGIEAFRNSFDEEEALAGMETAHRTIKVQYLCVGTNTKVVAVVTKVGLAGVNLWLRDYVDCTAVRPVE